MTRITGIALTAVSLVAVSMVYVAMGQGIQFGKGENPLTIHRLLDKFFAAQATAPFRYPTACIAGTALEYTQMALQAAQPDSGGAQLHLWTVPEAFGPVGHPEPDRKSGRCDYRVSFGGAPGDTHVIAEFFSRKQPRIGEIAYTQVWQQGGNNALRVGFPNGPRGRNPHFTFKAVPVGSQP